MVTKSGLAEGAYAEASPAKGVYRSSKSSLLPQFPPCFTITDADVGIMYWCGYNNLQL